MVNANDDSALLCAWTKTDQSLVRKGEIIAVIETSKATINVESGGHWATSTSLYLLAPRFWWVRSSARFVTSRTKCLRAL